MKLIYFIIAITIAVGGLYFYRSINTEQSIPPFLRQFKLVEAYEDTQNRFRGLYVSDDNKIRVNIQNKISKSQAQEITNLRIMALNALFEDKVSAYPGQISKEISCNQKYKPEIEKIAQNDTEITFAKGLFTDRFTMGACVDDLLPNKGFIAWYWCSQTNTLNQVEMISPKENDKIETILSSLGCSN
ncbi:hypothetical protein HZB78_00670 [Candidatus Collierbacteria bacterium]|nr:hypothetical protein [Candidatus Collierbacteria bacterium]